VSVIYLTLETKASSLLCMLAGYVSCRYCSRWSIPAPRHSGARRGTARTPPFEFLSAQEGGGP